MATETCNLSSQKTVPASLRGWMVGGLLVMVAVAALLSFNARLDTFLWRGTRWLMGTQDTYVWQDYKVDTAMQTAGGGGAPWYRTMEPPGHGNLYHSTRNIWQLFKDAGEPYTLVFVVAMLWIYDRRAWRAGALLVAVTSVTGLVSVLIRMTGGRLRPNGHFSAMLMNGGLNDGGNYWELFRGFVPSRGGDLGFSSGHATLAFATAAVLSYLSPRGRWLFFTVAACCALSRVVMQAHFYSDVIFGGFLGWALASWLVRRGDHLLNPVSERPPLGGDGGISAHLHTPQLAHLKQAEDFRKQVVEIPADAKL